MEKNDEMMIRRKAVEGFLVQLALRRRLSEIDAGEDVHDMTQEEIAAARVECARRIHPFDQEIAPGHVRMLSGTERPTYVLVARRWTNKSWLVIPFSDFSEPATETELKFRIDGGVGIRVLQLWNARSLLEQTLAKSWLVYTLQAAELDDAITAWKWSVGEGELSDDQIVRTGLPIMRRDDPRIAYEDSEISNFAKLDGEDIAATTRLAWQEIVRMNIALRGRIGNAFGKSRAFEDDKVLAAADVTAPVSADCKVEGLDGVVHVRYAPADGHLMLRVFGPDGNRSQVLDGWGVFGKDAELLGMISEASFACEIKDGFDGVLALADEDGNVYSLQSEVE